MPISAYIVYIRFFVVNSKSIWVILLLHNLYIIRQNGICIFHEKYGSLEEDPQSIAGFLTAISMFSKSIIGEEVNSISTKRFKFIFKADGKFLFVTFVDKSDDVLHTQQILDEVQKIFHNRFPKAEEACKSGSLLPFERLKDDLSLLLPPIKMDCISPL